MDACGSDVLCADKLTLYDKARHSKENLDSSAEESGLHLLNSGGALIKLGLEKCK